MARQKDKLTPSPKKGDVLAVYKPEFSAFGGTAPEEHLGLARVERVTPKGQLTLTGRYVGRVFGANGVGQQNASSTRAKLHVRWPTDADRAEYRNLFLLNALLGMPWGRRTDEEIEAVAKILKVEVTVP